MLRKCFILLVLFASAGCGTQQFKADTFHVDEMIGWGPQGMAWNGKEMIIGHERLISHVTSIEMGRFSSTDSPYTSDGFYLYSRTPISISLPKPIKICGLAWEGACCESGYLWIADSLNKEIIKIKSNGEIIKTMAFPGQTPNGLAFDGSALWAADSGRAKIYRISPVDESVMFEFNSPIKEPTGLAWDYSNLWIVGMDACKDTISGCVVPRLVKLDIVAGIVTHEIELPEQIKSPSALEWSNGSLWVADTKLSRVFRLSDKGSEIQDPTNYISAVTVQQKKLLPPKRLTIKDMPKIESDKRDAEEARRLAEETRRAAEDAKKAAEKAEKAFELQQRK
ncbi:MAG: hypothetical protein L0Y62_00900 [Nitrospirae bacterium]|nr:hypothetical protein [Nitrospirota bacterium]